MDRVTIREIASLCGVGVSTVSRAMNNHPDINESTRKKIMDMIEQYHYVPNNSARNLKRSDAKTIAILIKGISNPFFGKMIKVFEAEVKKRKYDLVIQHVDELQDEIEAAIQLEKEKRLNGIVFLGGFFSHSEEKLKGLHIPYVLCTTGLEEPSKSHPVVCVDDRKESFRMVNYLIAQGHKRIAILAPPLVDESIGRLRLEGYKNALEDSGISYDESLVVHMKDSLESYSTENGYEMTKELLKSGVRFSAVFALSDRMAIGACKAVFDSGKRVPEDYSVAGFDGIDMAFYYQPSIATIRQPVEKIAKESIRILFEVIEELPGERRIVFDGDFVSGQSVRRI